MKLEPIDEFLLSFEEIEDIELTEDYINMVDIEVEDDASFLLANNIISHNSAVGGISKVLGRDDYAYFALRGKPLNVYDAPTSKIVANKELNYITQILNLDLTNKNTKMDFENILIATDADLDGILIRGLILTFFNKFAPNLIKEGKVQVLATPMITAIKKGVVEKYFMTFEDYTDFQNKNKGYNYNYYKGLGSWRGKEDLGAIIEKFGLESFIDPFQCGDDYSDALNSWMSKDASDKRKDYLRGKEFDIFKV